MRSVVFMPRAESQLNALYRYLADRFYPESTGRFLLRLRDVCESLAFAPERGTLQPEFGPGVRVIGFERRTSIYFRVSEIEITILAICYGGKIPGRFR